MPTRCPRITHLAAGLLLLAVSCISVESRAATAGESRGRVEKATQTLFEAVHTNDFAAAEAAVAAGADVDAKNRWNLTPAELAIDKGYFRIAHFLVSVRNNRAPAESEAAAERPLAASRKASGPAARATERQASADRRSASSEPAPQPWPADMPNPFDPAAPAFGTGLPVIEPTQSFLTGPADGQMLATDTPADGSALR